MFTHGTITGLLFMMVGLTYDKAHTRQLDELGGLARRMPIVAILFLVAGLASLGLPGMSGFVSEVLVFLGTFPVMPIATILAAFGIVLTAGYILWMLERAFFGTLNPRHDHVDDARGIELIPIYVTAAAIILVGLYPSLITTIFDNGIQNLVLALG
jgi:NADH-quinone oxidoreductase subunit M